MLNFNEYSMYVVDINLNNKLYLINVGDITLLNLRFSYSFLESTSTFFDIGQLRLYFYTVFLSDISLHSRSVFYDGYMFFLKGSSVKMFSIFFIWFFFCYLYVYENKFYLNMYTDSLLRHFSIRFPHFDTLYMPHWNVYMFFLSGMMFNISFRTSECNHYISRLWLSHTFLNI